MSDPNPSFKIDGNVENSTIIFGDSNRAVTSNEQHPDCDLSDAIGVCDQTSQVFSAADRRRLRQTLNALPLSVFEDLVFDLAVPDDVFSVKSSQSEHCRSLLSWAENTAGIGLATVEKLLIPMMAEQAKRSLEYLSCVLEGEPNQQTIAELQSTIQQFRQMTEDDSIAINFVEEGSIRMVLSGSSEGLKKLKDLYESGELGNLDIPSVKTVQPIENDTTSARKARLVDALKLNDSNFWYVLAGALARDRDLAIDLALVRDSARANDLVNDLAIVRILTNNHDSDSNSDLIRDLDLNLDLALARANDLARDLAIANDLASDSNSNIIFNRALANAIVNDLALALDLDRDRDRDRVITLFSSRARARARAIALDLAIASALVYDRARDSARALNLDLSDVDLKGTNLRNLYLVGVDLTGSDLTGANVQGTVFGDNEGLSELTKRDLEKRGAIFQDSPDSNVPSIVRV